MPRVSRNNLGKFASRARRKRTSVATRAKYQKPTARNQRAQILGNASAIRTIRSLMPKPVYTDFQYCAGYGPFFPGAPAVYTSILSDQLMNPTQWVPVLRRDANVLQSSTTLVKRLQINMRYNLGASNWCQMTTFIVSLRRDAANRVVDPALLVENDDFIVSTQEGFNARLNPAVFKVHYARNISLAANVWQEEAAVVGGQAIAGNATTTFRKGQINLKLNYKLRQPTSVTPWKTMTMPQLPHYQRLYILTFFKGQTDGVDDDPPGVFYDCLYTCYNAS